MRGHEWSCVRGLSAIQWLGQPVILLTAKVSRGHLQPRGPGKHPRRVRPEHCCLAAPPWTAGSERNGGGLGGLEGGKGLTLLLTNRHLKALAQEQFFGCVTALWMDAGDSWRSLNGGGGWVRGVEEVAAIKADEGGGLTILLCDFFIKAHTFMGGAKTFHVRCVALPARGMYSAMQHGRSSPLPLSLWLVAPLCIAARGAMPPCVRSVAPAPCVTFRRVTVSLRGPGQSPVLPFACCVGSLPFVGCSSLCSCWCCCRVRRGPSLVYWGCAGRGKRRLCVSGAQLSAYRGCAGCCGGSFDGFCCPHSSAQRSSTTCLTEFPCA